MRGGGGLKGVVGGLMRVVRLGYRYTLSLQLGALWSETMSEYAVSAVRRGESAKWSEMLIPTTKEAPGDAESPSHVYLSRAGYVKRLAAGVYSYLPLGYRTLRKVEAIVREEMGRAGTSELLMSALVPIEGYFSESGRHEEYGDLLFRFEDRHGRDTALGPTHEEVVTSIMRDTVSSYRQLPLNVYQIQTKYRDEFRPRAGLLRCREFLMKDAYSFHMSLEGAGGLNETYDRMYEAYVSVFTRLGLDFGAVEAEAGPIGGSASHEFMVYCDSGEDTVLVDRESGYAANVEKCEIGERSAPESGWFAGEPTGELTKNHTPGMPGIDLVSKHLKVKPTNMLKTIVFSVIGVNDESKAGGIQAGGFVAAIVRGDQEVNEGKVRDESGCAIELAEMEDAKAAGFAVGYVSPRAVVKHNNTLVFVDPDAAVGIDVAKGKAMFWATGADEMEHHDTHFNWVRDLGIDPIAASSEAGGMFRVASVRNAQAGDPSPRSANALLEEKRGVEVGHIFKLGTKYSEAMGYSVLGEDQERAAVIMGCYGIGVSRTVAACVEMSHDDDGIIWPIAVAPYHVLITMMKAGDERQQRVCNELVAGLIERGFDVLIDDRDERPGSKFKDADLVGIPIRLTLGDKALDQGCVEFKLRADSGKGEMVEQGAIVERCLGAARL